MKKLVCVLLLFIVFMSNEYTVQAAGFKDVPKDHYAYDAIMWAEEYDIINGYADGTFKPNATITEQQFAKLLVNFYELESPLDKLKKQTPTAIWSDEFYNRLASYAVPLNGYFDNTIRAANVKRGVVAQAITHLANGKSGLDQSIQFLLDYYISTGQNFQYENRNLQKFFGVTNFMTRAQVVTMLHRMDERNFYEISEDAQASHDNKSNDSLNTRAKNGQNQLDKIMQLTTPSKSAWNGSYSYYYKWGNGITDFNRRDAYISNATSKNFHIFITSNDGVAAGSVDGTATITSSTKAVMNKSSNGNRCVLEFERLNNALKIIEVDCRTEHDEGTNFSGTLKKQ
ncbi:S-layer homology domain-containing protein [Lysinibacillus sp. Bpr_S20]|uniref:S-layer homology domain-containing protein n=1 Tax=Lysinibacillus sp. Bpr_S20 TaxID=2933964 RepID=UPI0020127174|nr:S-layer homology domain-containing protein [Lysinibacillus sp. Bpr_S20]MCL1700378.1 S-layer homology domain-containing protein [Lysinibacillus sp. Bpr_S20]